MNPQKKEENKNSFSYKDTLNLLKTDFSMRANSVNREPEIQKFWKDNNIDMKLGQYNKGEKFTLHDGPPYANGSLHMGHALNKILKDIINKYKTLKGHKVHFVPGWDCHGLPIELKVLQNLKIAERKNLDVLGLRKKATEYANTQINNQKKGFKRWGIWGDWDNPYLTLKKNYESAQIGVFWEMFLNGYIYRGLKPVHWSPSSRTALAEAELEYPDQHFSKSVYVSFQVTNFDYLFSKVSENILEKISDLDIKKLFITIWTTTPWTLPANEAVAVNPRIFYVLAIDKNKEIFVFAKDLLEKISIKFAREFKVLCELSGSDLEGLKYKHPIKNKICSLVLGGEYITTESGTGIVHTAPGHGMDDFIVGQKYNLPITCVVDEKGNLNEKSLFFEGLNVLKNANDVIIEFLIQNNSLLLIEDYQHRYPYDWRTKKPTIFRATEQWFASVEGFRSSALKAIDEVEWMPESGKKRIHSMVVGRGDWCISRQRSWGVPIPVFYNKNNQKILIDADTINHIQTLFKEFGADIWWEWNEDKLLPKKYLNDANNWKKGLDTMDVWFDSGSSWAAVCKQREELKYPADLYLEGSDQHRGWFQSSLLTSVAVNNKAPYKKVLTHGFALDEKGRKMSKSLGNIVDPNLIINGGPNQKINPAYGADVLRLWVSSVDYSVDVPIGSNILKQLSDVYRKIRNTSRYLLGNIHDYDPRIDDIEYSKLPLLDQWMLHKLVDTFEQISIAYENYEFSKFFQIIQNFCVSDLSNFYLDIAKDRLYISAPSDFRRRSCQYIISKVIENLAVLISPVLSHMAEDIWQNIPYDQKEKSVFQRGWPRLPEQWLNPELDKQMVILRKLRVEINKSIEECRNKKKIGAALEAQVIVLSKSQELNNSFEFLDQFGNKEVDLYKDWLIVSEFQLVKNLLENSLHTDNNEFGQIQIIKAEGFKCDRCWHYQKEVLNSEKSTKLCKRCSNILKGI
ncbi:MAG: isoleucine--tRNA ligase [Prochlorococcus sp. SP3034]|nr:isoleucine--tRNA ligase [Prochlorococcus sp. SP3034]|tara:strand:- start:6595 stop:9492 length:2898 start_codon:yes stop_codon:yes gene_type:complete